MPHPFHVSASNFKHLPVMADEVLAFIKKLPQGHLTNGLFIDATIGGGGHSGLFLEVCPNVKVIGIDQDPFARKAAQEKLAKFGSRIQIIASNFADFVPPEKASFVFADLGVSSHQLDFAPRGFSFRLNGPLDMRMNPEIGITAESLLNKLSEKDLADIIFSYGEERLSRRIARKIKIHLEHKGPFKGTEELSYLIGGCFPPKMRKGRIHPATRTFQALRIAVNNEIDSLNHFLEIVPEWVNHEGLIGIISFHSLEDKRVKNAFVKDERLERITKKPIIANEKEILKNPRSRSGKLRVAKRK